VAYRNFSLYAIYGPADRSLYVGQSSWLKSRLGRHDHQLERGNHHSPLLLTSYANAQRTGKPLQVLGLDWDTDETLILVMETLLLARAKVYAPRWKITNETVPTERELTQTYSRERIKQAVARISERAEPSLARMKPVSTQQITGTLSSFRVHTENFGPRMRA